MIKQTAGRDQLGDFTPEFACLNDDVLFGEIWSDEKLSQRDRSFVTVTALINMGAFEQLPYHMQKAKENGISQVEISTLVTHLAFHVGWPKAWSVSDIAKKIY